MSALGGHVIVIGDVMLDVFSEGSATRISPEAPVPVLSNPRHREVLGGAANTALNVRTLGAEARIVGVIGDDAAGRRCASLALESGLVDGLVVSAEHPTTVKTRYVASGQQIMRLDVESKAVPATAHGRLIDAVRDTLGDASCVIISDYQKGAISADVVTAIIEAATAAGVPVVVDSKCKDFSIYRGARVITPNHLEATAATGEEDSDKAAALLAAATGGDVIVTLGPDGMLVRSEEGTTRVPSEVQEVSDVTGAGDTVTAAVAVALAEGASVLEAAQWATAAAAVAVAHHGTYAVRRAEIAIPVRTTST